jgi:hypothetical protein
MAGHSFDRCEKKEINNIFNFSTPHLSKIKTKDYCKKK